MVQQAAATGLPTVYNYTTTPTGTVTTVHTRNQPTVITDTLGRRTELAYDPDGNLIRQTTGITTAFPLGFTTIYTYTAANRPAAQQGPDGVVVAYAYDSQGQVTQSTPGAATPDAQVTGYGYDSLGRVVTTTVGVGTALERRDVTDYNADNTVVRTVRNYQDGLFDPAVPTADIVTTYGYDALGRPVWVQDVLGRADVTHYDAAGRVDWTTRNLTPFQVDADGLLPVAPDPEPTPTPDPYPAPTTEAAPPRPVIPQTRTIAYTYDGLQRLTGATETPSTTYEYSYDLAGNRTEVRENGAPVANLRYNDANQVIGWSYDAAGNLLSDGTSSRSYDALNRLVAQAGTSYTYNGDGVLVSDGTTTYAQDLAAPLSQVLSDGTANYVYGHERLRALGGPWYVGDALGSVRQTLDDAGGVLATTQYDPWGTPQGTLSTPFGFTGELHSAGQVYLRARWYAPGQGRFVSKDPFAGFAEMPYSLHAYQYGYSAPTVWTDPTGKCIPEYIVVNGRRIPIPGGEPGCLPISETGTGLNWEDGGQYLWDVFEGIGSPGAWIVDQFAGTNGWDCIWQDAGIGTQLGGVFTTVATVGGTYKYVVVPVAQRAAALLASTTTAGGAAIARYTPADAKALERFAREAAAYNGGRGRVTFPWEALVKKPGEVIIYRVGGRIVGAMRVQQTSFRGKPVLSIEEVESIQTGVGRILLRNAAERALRENLAGLTGLPDAQALRLYQRYGAQDVGLGRYFLDAEALRKILKN